MRRLVTVVALFLVLFGATHTAVAAASDTFKDCDVCPGMVVIPAGQFMMGSPSYEEGRSLGRTSGSQIQLQRNPQINSKFTETALAALHCNQGRGEPGQRTCPQPGSV